MVDPGIVVGVDGSRSSLDAVRWAAREAGVREAPLLLLSCITYRGAQDGPRLAEILHARAERDVAEALETARAERDVAEALETARAGPQTQTSTFGPKCPIRTPRDHSSTDPPAQKWSYSAGADSASSPTG